MQAPDLKRASVDMSLLLCYFSKNKLSQEGIEYIGRFLTLLVPVRAVALLCDGKAVDWKSGEHEERDFCILLERRAPQLFNDIRSRERLGGLVEWSETGFGEYAPALVCAVRYDDRICGLLAVLREGGTWSEAEKEYLRMFGDVLGLAFAFERTMEDHKLRNFVFNTVLNEMKASVYITDIQTDKILFMNQAMKEDYGIQEPEGQVCWKVLQRGMSKRCSFCPVDKLASNKERMSVMQWEEMSTVTGRAYQNYDRLIRWMDGSIVHLQQSIDVTELKSANTDELTSFLTRKPGKEALRVALTDIQKNKQAITVCLYDINLLKDVNDSYGHAEGDRMIAMIAEEVRKVLTKNEFSFRLSGDEFVIVFYSQRKNAQRRMEAVIKSLHAQQLGYEMSICYGMVEVSPEEPLAAEEALLLADMKMYEQKQRYHILRNRQRQKEQTALRASSAFVYDEGRLYSALTQSTDDYIYVCNMKTGVFRYPRAMVEEFDLPSEVIGNAAAVWGAKVHPDDRAAFLESNQEITDRRSDSHCVEYRAQNRRGEWIWVRCRGHLELDENGDPSIFAGFITNLGQKNRIDHLTGLFNKLEFEAQIRRLIEVETDRPIGIMILGIDDLKHINDLYDRAFGDEVIRIASHKIRGILPSEADIYRLDGDEFGIVAREADLEKMQKIYRGIYHSFENQQEYDGKKYYATFSAGCLFYPRDAGNYLDLIKYAGYLLGYAKSHGKKRCVFFSQEILGHRARALAMMESLRESMENDFAGFSLKFQPLVEAGTGTLLGAEALVRWECEQFGQVSPVEFIPLLEESGMIVPVGKWIFRSVMRICGKWRACRPDFFVDVNLSYRQIEETDFVSFLREAMQEDQYPAANLVVELTESYFAQQNNRVRAIFEELRSMGVRIAMDDFGTGYSTLGILKEVPADIVKIDKTFVRGIRTSNFDATFIRFVVALCHDVGIKVCLEGVETEAEYQIVKQMGLDMIQGYLFDKPLSERQFSEKYL